MIKNNDRMRVVFDTNVIISRILTPKSTAAKAVIQASMECALLASQETFDELAVTIQRKKFQKYLPENYMGIISKYAEVIEWIPIIQHVKHCRDPKDDKFLELALNGGAKYIVSGDEDLLGLKFFHKTRIIPPAAFLAKLS